MKHDVIVIGGSYAGMAAALQLVRARKHVLVIDAGQRRNRTTPHSHGFLGQDGVDPAELAQVARAQLMAYPSLAWIDGEAEQASGSNDAFRVISEGKVHEARRLVLATGLRDDLPDIPGMAERWGRSIFHCPYCHGYELDRGRIGVIATGPMSVHQAHMVAEWGDTTFLVNGTFKLDATAADELVRRGVTIETTPIAQILGHADIGLADSRRLVFNGLFTAPRSSPATPIAGRLGCTLVDTPMGTQIQTSETKETSIQGAFACGDVARFPHSLSLAVADGAWAGTQVHRSLIWPVY